MQGDAALVLFSGGQDSTVCLAWALERFGRVETVGFDYGQRHRTELAVRARLRARMVALEPAWGRALGEDHVVRLDALAAISDTALTREVEIEIGAGGLPTTFVPGRNLVFLAFAGALAYRRGIKHLVAGMCETDFSGYPDCRDDTLKAMQLALNLGMERRFVIHTPLMWIDTAAMPSSTCWSRIPTPAISATARAGTTGATAAGNARPAACGRRDLPGGRPHNDATDGRGGRPSEAAAAPSRVDLNARP